MSERWRCDGIADVTWTIKDTKDPESGAPTMHIRLGFTANGVHHENAVRLRRGEPDDDHEMIRSARNILIVWAEEIVSPSPDGGDDHAVGE